MALAHTILVTTYHVLIRREPYRDLGPMTSMGTIGRPSNASCVRRLKKRKLKASIEPAA